MDAWGEFEALNALANYARENPDSTFPEFSGEAAQFEAVALGHPLLPDETCVRNGAHLAEIVREGFGERNFDDLRLIGSGMV